jgi:hypothetical protein
MADSAPIPWHSTRLALDALALLGPEVTFTAASMPPYTAAVPDMLRLAGISAISVPGAPACRWIGQGGGEVALNGPGVDGRVHRGHLAFARGISAPADHIEDDWDARLDDAETLLNVKPDENGDFHTLNVLPWRRRACAHLRPLSPDRPDDDPIISVELEAGAVTCLDPQQAGAPGARWEVSATVLDQGRVRAEFDAAGRVARLCWNNVFAQPLAPWPSGIAGPMDRRDLLMDAGAAASEATCNLQDPPWSASVVFGRQIGDGRLSISYGLGAHDDALEIFAAWQGSGPLTLRHPTLHCGAQLECGDERSRWTVPQAASALGEPVRVHGLRHAALAAGDGRGLCLVFSRPTTVVAWDGDLRIEIQPGDSIRYALIAAQRPPEALTRLQSAVGFRYHHHPITGTLASPVRPVRPVLPAGVEALWWCGVPAWDGEILLVEQSLATARAYLFVPAGKRPGRASRVDARGNVLAEVEPTREGDGWVVDLDPGMIALVRWRWA